MKKIDHSRDIRQIHSNCMHAEYKHQHANLTQITQANTTRHSMLYQTNPHKVYVFLIMHNAENAFFAPHNPEVIGSSPILATI